MKLESNFSKLLRGSGYPGRKKIRNELYIFSICLVISIFIWFLIALSKEVYTTLEYPVKFVHTPADMVLVNEPDSILSFRISSGGFELFTLQYLSAKNPIEIDLRNISLEKQDGFYTGIFNTSRLSDDIRKQYRFSEELVSISPENLYFRFEPLTGKMVPVVSGLKLEFQKQFRLSDSITFTPAEVKVIGPRNLIDKITRVETEAKPVSGIEGSVSGTCMLKKPVENEQLALLPDQVAFAINAERYTESTLLVPVLPANKNQIVKIFPEKVNVTFLVSLSNFKRINPDLFHAVIEVPESDEIKVKAPVRLANVPGFIEVTKIDPPEVDFLVIQK